MSHHLMQGPGRPTQNSQQAGIAERILDFARHRSPPPAEIPTVVQTPASPVPSIDSEGKFLLRPNPFHSEEDQDFSTTIQGPVFQTPGPETLELPAESAGEPTTESSVTEDYVHYQYQTHLTDTLRAMTDLLAALSVPPPPAPLAPVEPKSRVKPRSPDTFDGSNPGKLDAFIFQCSMYIVLCGQDFPDEASKVAFMLSYLKGSALDWFQTAATHGSSGLGLMSTAWLSSTPVFIDELCHLFGPRDPVNEATIRIENLRYKDAGKAVKYTLDFNRDALRTGWNDKALYWQFYKGLLDRLKDKLTRIGKAETLIPLQHQVQVLDQRYWERQAEISCDKRASNTAPARTDKPRQSFSDNNSSRPVASSSQTPAQSKSSSSSKPKNPNANKLGKNGKLTPEERDRRFKLQLCLFCGNAGHKVTECPSAKNSAKGKASSTEPAKQAKE